MLEIRKIHQKETNSYCLWFILIKSGLSKSFVSNNFPFMETGQNCMVPPGFIERQPLHQSTWSRRGAKTASDLWHRRPEAWLLTLHRFYSGGGSFKFTLWSLVILNLLAILIPSLYDVSADEKQQIRRQRPGKEADRWQRRVLASHAQWGGPSSSTLDGPRQQRTVQRETLYPWQAAWLVRPHAKWKYQAPCSEIVKNFQTVPVEH